MVSCLLLAAAALTYPGRGPRLPGGWAVMPPGSGAGRPGGRQWWLAGGRRTSAVRRSWGASARDGGGTLISRPVVSLLAAGLFVATLLVAGPAGAVAAAAVLATGCLLVGRSIAERRRSKDMTDVVAALRMFGRELRSGAEPSVAADRAIVTARGEGAAVLAGLSQLVRVGDRTETSLARPVLPTAASPGSAALSRLSVGWRLTAKYGVALAPMVESLARELADQLASDAQRSGQVAGPRTSGYVMAALPLLGIALGAGMGAQPVQVLLDSPVGNILLLVGVSLICSGLLWAARIVGQ
jgi:tight adherence protein B